MSTQLRRMFAFLDTDQDGYLTEQDLTAIVRALETVKRQFWLLWWDR
ncbi:EF-hand domain-containing protein [Streptomyces sp. Rer75]|nr:EF-hand domain-containing protein [Streptomyces sp. Rer75]QLH19383.1 hypothetical protein HYQ63_00685 [Streptomyces sp. Rer75]QLH26681.1 hypothetical protein HYQ63_43840 [Streptomyces sp. Rer75]